MARVVNTDGIPTILPDSRPPSDYQQISADSSSFGGQMGGAEQRAGSELEQGSNQLATAAIQKQDIYNQIAADGAHAQLRDGFSNLLYGDPNKPGDTGYFGMTGEAAMKARPDVQKAMNQQMEQISAGLQNDSQRREFLNNARRTADIYVQQVGRHYEQASKVWGISTMQGGAVAAERDIANSYSDPVALANGMASLRSSVVKEASLTGKNPEVALAEADSRGAIAAINGAIARNDYAWANQFFQAHGNAIDDQNRAVIAGHLRTKATAADGAALLDSIRGNTPAGGGSAAPPTIPANLEQMGRAAAAKYGVPWDVFSHQIAGESGWNPGVAKSSAGAEGIAQFIPGTATQYGVDVKNPQSSLEGAAHYMADLHQQSGSWEHALSGYLSGRPGPEIKSVTSQNKEYANAYAAARTADAGGAVIPGAQLVSSTGQPPVAGPNTVPPASQPPGMAQLAQTMLETDQAYGRELAGLDASPTRSSNPDVWAAARAQSEKQYQQKRAALTGAMQALKAVREATYDDVMQQVLKSPTDPAIVDAIANNPNLDAPSRISLNNQLKEAQKGTLAGDIQSYGPGYRDVNNLIVNPSLDPDKRINDASQILSKADEVDANGRHLITPAGVAELLKNFKETRSDIVKAREHENVNQVYQDAIQHLATGPLLTGESKIGTGEKTITEADKPYVRQFDLAYTQHIADGQRAGLPMYKILDPAAIQKLWEPIDQQRTAAQKALDASKAAAAQAEVQKATEEANRKIHGTPTPGVPPAGGLSPADWLMQNRALWAPSTQPEPQAPIVH